MRPGSLQSGDSLCTGIRYDDESVYFVNGCGCESRLEPIGILMLWRSYKVCEAHGGSLRTGNETP